MRERLRKWKRELALGILNEKGLRVRGEKGLRGPRDGGGRVGMGYNVNVERGGGAGGGGGRWGTEGLGGKERGEGSQEGEGMWRRDGKARWSWRRGWKGVQDIDNGKWGFDGAFKKSDADKAAATAAAAEAAARETRWPPTGLTAPGDEDGYGENGGDMAMPAPPPIPKPPRNSVVMERLAEVLGASSTDTSFGFRRRDYLRQAEEGTPRKKETEISDNRRRRHADTPAEGRDLHGNTHNKPRKRHENIHDTSKKNRTTSGTGTGLWQRGLEKARKLKLLLLPGSGRKTYSESRPATPRITLGASGRNVKTRIVDTSMLHPHWRGRRAHAHFNKREENDLRGGSSSSSYIYTHSSPGGTTTHSLRLPSLHRHRHRRPGLFSKHTTADMDKPKPTTTNVGSGTNGTDNADADEEESVVASPTHWYVDEHDRKTHCVKTYFGDGKLTERVREYTHSQGYSNGLNIDYSVYCEDHPLKMKQPGYPPPLPGYKAPCQCNRCQLALLLVDLSRTVVDDKGYLPTYKSLEDVPNYWDKEDLKAAAKTLPSMEKAREQALAEGRSKHLWPWADPDSVAMPPPPRPGPSRQRTNEQQHARSNLERKSTTNSNDRFGQNLRFVSSSANKHRDVVVFERESGEEGDDDCYDYDVIEGQKEEAYHSLSEKGDHLSQHSAPGPGPGADCVRPTTAETAGEQAPTVEQTPPRTPTGTQTGTPPTPPRKPARPEKPHRLPRLLFGTSESEKCHQHPPTSSPTRDAQTATDCRTNRCDAYVQEHEDGHEQHDENEDSPGDKRAPSYVGTGQRPPSKLLFTRPRPRSLASTSLSATHAYASAPLSVSAALPSPVPEEGITSNNNAAENVQVDVDQQHAHDHDPQQTVHDNQLEERKKHRHSHHSHHNRYSKSSSNTNTNTNHRSSRSSWSLSISTISTRASSPLSNTEGNRKSKRNSKRDSKTSNKSNNKRHSTGIYTTNISDSHASHAGPSTWYKNRTKTTSTSTSRSRKRSSTASTTGTTGTTGSSRISSLDKVTTNDSLSTSSRHSRTHGRTHFHARTQSGLTIGTVDSQDSHYSQDSQPSEYSQNEDSHATDPDDRHELRHIRTASVTLESDLLIIPLEEVEDYVIPSDAVVPSDAEVLPDAASNAASHAPSDAEAASHAPPDVPSAYSKPKPNEQEQAHGHAVEEHERHPDNPHDQHEHEELENEEQQQQQGSRGATGTARDKGKGNSRRRESETTDEELARAKWEWERRERRTRPVAQRFDSGSGGVQGDYGRGGWRIVNGADGSSVRVRVKEVGGEMSTSVTTTSTGSGLWMKGSRGTIGTMEREEREESVD